MISLIPETKIYATGTCSVVKDWYISLSFLTCSEKLIAVRFEILFEMIKNFEN